MPQTTPNTTGDFTRFGLFHAFTGQQV